MRLRIMAVLLAAVVLGGSLGAGVAGAAPYDRGTANACPGDVPDQFDDDEASLHEANVNCIAHWKITQGVSARRYGPAIGTRRDQMATFVVNLMATAGYAFPAAPPDAFGDDEASVHEASVNKLAAANVVEGMADGGYHPAELVRRDQMATYIAKAIEAVAGATLLHGEDYFTDDQTSAHHERINDIAALGIVQGTRNNAYAPREQVRRDQMASFIAKAADYLAGAGHWPSFGTNQAFRVTPVEAAVAALGTGRAYVAQVGDVASVDVGLVPCDEVAVGPTGVVTFGDDEATAGQADDMGGTTATIELVNGSAGAGDHVDAAAATNGVVSLTANSTVADTCIRPVVFRDANNNQQLDLDSNDRPSESFGVGGEIRWVAPEAASGPFSVVDVATVAKANDLFTGNAGSGLRTFFYDTNDSFRIGGVAATMSQFESALSAYDAVSGTYADDPAGVSTFDLTDSDPAGPSGVAVVAEGSTATVTWTGSTTAAVDAYRVFRAATAADCNGESAYAQVGEVTGAQLTKTDSGLDGGRYCYKVRAVDDGDESGDSNEALAVVDLTPPTISDIRAQEGAGSTNGVLDSGDFVQVIFSEVMAASVDDSGSALTLTGGTLTCGTNASCVLQPAGTYNGVAYEAGRVMRIKVIGAVGGVSYPATVTGVSTHWNDLAGNQLTLTGGDVSLEVAAVSPAAEAAPPNMGLGSRNQASGTIAVTYTEPVVCSDDAGTRNQFRFNDADDSNVVPTAIGCDGTAVVLLTFPAGVVETADGSPVLNYTDDSASIDANDMRDLNGNSANLNDNLIVS